MAVPLTEARAEVVRARILEGLAAILQRGETWTFAKVAKRARVPERTLYRYFPTREALLQGIFEWANARLGFQGELPVDAAALEALVRRSFPGFDTLAPVVRELLLAPEGRLARLRQKSSRQRSSLALVQLEVPGLPDADARRLAAVLQLLGQAATWQSLRDYWDMDGVEAAESSVLAIRLLLEGARSRAALASKPSSVESKKKRTRRSEANA
jgi:AcrR family transcriptional regulator